MTEPPDEHIEYVINWRVANIELEGSCLRRFSEFYGLHLELKKELAPAQLPEFPRKSYVSSFKTESE